jgi:hypothetical protein
VKPRGHVAADGWNSLHVFRPRVARADHAHGCASCQL